ncbi:MAG: cupin domain-containing protein [Pseudomonadota bacterium]
MPEPVTPLQSQLSQIDTAQPLPFALLHADDDITVILYHPQGEDQQTPHDQDEFYFIASGEAEFFIQGENRPVRTGDAVFVPAFAEHRFVAPSADFSCWAIFYGPRRKAD